MPGWAAAVIGVCLCVFEAVVLQVLHIDRFSFQLWIPMTVWLAMQKDWGTSALVLALLFLPIEWSAGGRMGLVSFGLILPFALIRLSGLSVSAASFLTHMLIGATFAVLHDLSMVTVLLIIDPSSRIIPAILWNIGASVGVSALCTPILLRALSRIEAWFAPHGRTAGARR